MGVSQERILREKLTCQNRGGEGEGEGWKNIAFSQYSTQLSNFYELSDSRVIYLTYEIGSRILRAIMH